MYSIFISHKHSDDNVIQEIKAIRGNINHPLIFKDSSLAEPICNDYYHVNRRPPTDPASMPVKATIKPLLEQSDKLLVLIGKDTHSSLWVQWEIDAFTSKHGNSNILLMRVPVDKSSGPPNNASHHKVSNWSLSELTDWSIN